MFLNSLTFYFVPSLRNPPSMGQGSLIFCSTGFIIFNNLNYSNVPLLKIMCILKYLLNILKIFFK